jgi:hypothetical protein
MISAQQLQVALTQDSQLNARVKRLGGKIEESTEGGRWHMVVVLPFKNVADLNDADSTYTFAAERGWISSTFRFEQRMRRAQQMPLPVRYEAAMPGSITSAPSGATVLGNTVSWTLPGIGGNFSVSSEQNNYLLFGGVLAGLIPIGGGVGFVYLRGRPSGQSWRCGKCGAINPQGSNSCQECGASLTS